MLCEDSSSLRSDVTSLDMETLIISCIESSLTPLKWRRFDNHCTQCSTFPNVIIAPLPLPSGHDNHISHIFNDKKEQQFFPSFTGGANSVCSSKWHVFVNIILMQSLMNIGILAKFKTKNHVVKIIVRNPTPHYCVLRCIQNSVKHKMGFLRK